MIDRDKKNLMAIQKRTFKKVIDACDRFNGLAIVNDRIVIVDLNKYEVRERNDG